MQHPRTVHCAMNHMHGSHVIPHHKHRTLTTSLSTAPGSPPEALLSQHRHKSLTDSETGESKLRRLVFLPVKCKYSNLNPTFHIHKMFTTEWDGGQTTPLQWRSPFTPDAMTGWVGHSLNTSHRMSLLLHDEETLGSSPALSLPGTDIWKFAYLFRVVNVGHSWHLRIW